MIDDRVTLHLSSDHLIADSWRLPSTDGINFQTTASFVLAFKWAGTCVMLALLDRHLHLLATAS